MPRPVFVGVSRQGAKSEQLWCELVAKTRQQGENYKGNSGDWLSSNSQKKAALGCKRQRRRNSVAARDRRSTKLVASDIRGTRQEAATQGLACSTAACEWTYWRSTLPPRTRRRWTSNLFSFQILTVFAPSSASWPLQEAIDAGVCGEQLPLSTLQRPAPACEPNLTQPWCAATAASSSSSLSRRPQQCVHHHAACANPVTPNRRLVPILANTGRLTFLSSGHHRVSHLNTPFWRPSKAWGIKAKYRL